MQKYVNLIPFLEGNFKEAHSSNYVIPRLGSSNKKYTIAYVVHSAIDVHLL